LNKQNITVIVPNYNGEGFIVDTIKSLINGFADVFIIIVDDVSTDDSVKIIEALNYNNIKLIKRESNGGFASAVNSGLRYCEEMSTEFVIIANSDTLVSRVNCDEIYASFLKFKDNNTAILGFLEEGLNIQRENEDISGFFFAMRLSIIKEIGYLDETFFMYGEEQDYFRRIIKHGYVISQTGIQISHLSEKSSSSSLYSSWLSIRNSIYLETKENNILKIFKKIVILFLLINKIYKPKVKNDPSLDRLYRAGILKGNMYLFKAILWNIFKQLGRIKNSK
jgi:GT2 family glycosyltransferase